MVTEIEQWIIDKRGQFEDEHGDVIIWFKRDKDLDGWYILMMDKKNRDKCIERVLSSTYLKYANFDALWYEFTSMRNRLMR